jgi:hypothetical protein
VEPYIAVGLEVAYIAVGLGLAYIVAGLGGLYCSRMGVAYTAVEGWLILQNDQIFNPKVLLL